MPPFTQGLGLQGFNSVSTMTGAIISAMTGAIISAITGLTFTHDLEEVSKCIYHCECKTDVIIRCDIVCSYMHLAYRGILTS